jgi:hypothetical protein
MVDLGSEICHDQEVTRLLSILRRDRLAEHNGNGNGNGSAGAQARDSASRHMTRARYVVTAAESAQCTCPEYCERDHEND